MRSRPRRATVHARRFEKNRDRSPPTRQGRWSRRDTNELRASCAADSTNLFKDTSTRCVHESLTTSRGILVGFLQDFFRILGGHGKAAIEQMALCAIRHDGGWDAIWREVISACGLLTIRFQSLPEQKKRPTAQASTRSVFDCFIAIVA